MALENAQNFDERLSFEPQMYRLSDAWLPFIAQKYATKSICTVYLPQNPETSGSGPGLQAGKSSHIASYFSHSTTHKLVWRGQPSTRPTTMSSIILPDSDTKPFKIDISNEAIEVLQKKLALTTLPDELEGAGRDYGVPLADVQRLLSRWKDGYDWRKYEKQLNDELPQFQKHIEVAGFDSLNIHYVHKKSEVEGAVPLLFVHGCESLG